jgi:hypothetical protein
VYTGDIVWKAERVIGGATDNMRYSFAATPVFYADLGGALPYIAGIVAADHGGQLWHVKTPAQALSSGVFAATCVTSTECYFTAEVFFSTLPDTGTPSRVYSDGDNILEAAEYQRRPFFFAPTLTANNGKVRVLIGSGDRDFLVPRDSLDDTIEDHICDDVQRLYAIDVGRCTTGTGTRACLESDLTRIDLATGGYAADTARGWYFELEAGEKAATPYDVFNGYGLYATFLPTTACDASVSECSAASAQGDARLYARHYLSGKRLDWDGNVDTPDDYQGLGSGVPTAPAVSVAIGPDGATPTIFAGGSDGGQLANTPAGFGSTSLALELMRFTVSPELHGQLHSP